MYSVYILPAENYCGVTNNFKRRLAEHRSHHDRNTEDAYIVKSFVNKEDALIFEEELQKEEGYYGFWDIGDAKPYTGHTPSAETREKQSIAMSGERNPWYGKKRNKHSKAMKEAHARGAYKNVDKSHLRKKVWDGNIEHKDLQTAAEYHGISYDTAKARCRLNLKNWSYR